MVDIDEGFMIDFVMVWNAAIASAFFSSVTPCRNVVPEGATSTRSATQEGATNGHAPEKTLAHCHEFEELKEEMKKSIAVRRR